MKLKHRLHVTKELIEKYSEVLEKKDENEFIRMVSAEEGVPYEDGEAFYEIILAYNELLKDPESLTDIYNDNIAFLMSLKCRYTNMIDLLSEESRERLYAEADKFFDEDYDKDNLDLCADRAYDLESMGYDLSQMHIELETSETSSKLEKLCSILQDVFVVAFMYYLYTGQMCTLAMHVTDTINNVFSASWDRLMQVASAIFGG